MTNWQDTYKELREQKTFYVIADEFAKQNADGYFDWLESEYPAIKNLIQVSRAKYKEELDDYFDNNEAPEMIVTLLNSIIDSAEVKKGLTEEAEKRLKELFGNNKNSDPLIANFQTIDNQIIEHLKVEVLQGVQFNSQSKVFFTNVLVEELYLNTLPQYFNELLNATPRKSLSDLLSKTEWEKGKKKLFDVLYSNFTGCDSEIALKELNEELEKTVKELEIIINSAKLEQEAVVTPIVTPGSGNNVSGEIKEIEAVINSFRGKSRTDRKDSDRSDLIVDLKKKKDWIANGTKAQKDAVFEKLDELEKTIDSLELEILQYNSIQEFQDELDDKQNNGKVKLTRNELVNQDYVDFDQKIFQINSKEEINNLKNGAIKSVISSRKDYSYLDNLIAEGNKALNGADLGVIRNILGALEVYTTAASEEGKRAYQQRSALINNLKNGLQSKLLNNHDALRALIIVQNSR